MASWDSLAVEDDESSTEDAGGVLSGVMEGNGQGVGVALALDAVPPSQWAALADLESDGSPNNAAGDHECEARGDSPPPQPAAPAQHSAQDGVHQAMAVLGIHPASRRGRPPKRRRLLDKGPIAGRRSRSREPHGGELGAARAHGRPEGGTLVVVPPGGRPRPSDVGSMPPLGTIQAVTDRAIIPFVPSPLVGDFEMWLQRARAEVQIMGRGLSEIDPGIAKLRSVLYGSGRLPSMNTEALCMVTGLPRKSFETRETLLASSVLLTAHCEQRSFERMLARAAEEKQVELILFVECSRMDETPLHLRTSTASTNRAMLLAGDGPVGRGGSATSREVMAGVQHYSQRKAKNDGPSKLLQVETNYAYLVKWVDDAGAPTYTCFLHSAPRRLHVLDQCTGENLSVALQVSSCASLASQSFAQKARVACNDKNKANEKAEKGLAARRGHEGWGSPCLFDCEVHVTSTIHGATFAVDLSAAVTGLIRTALSLANGACMTKFREAVAEVIRERLVIKVGLPTPEASQWRMRALHMFCGRGSRVVERLVTLGMLPNGDWRCQHEVQLYVLPQVRKQVGDERLVELMVQGLLMATCTSAPKVYARHRWTGMDLCLDSLGRLAVIHNILPEAFLRFCRSCGTMRPSRSSSGAQPQGGHDPQEVQGALCVAGGAMEEGTAQACPPPECADQVGHWQEENVLNRQLGLAFVESDPLVSLITMRMAVEPLRMLLQSKLEVADRTWEQRQQEMELQSQGEGLGRRRSFRVLVSATNVLEDAALSKVRLLFQEHSLWGLMPVAGQREDKNAAAFKALSTQGAMIEELLSAPHRRYPFRAFTALLGDAEARQVQEDKVCIRDHFMADFLRQNDVTTVVGKHALATIALVARTEICEIECLHASIRRLVCELGTQTYAVDFVRLAARWTSQRWRCELNSDERYWRQQGPEEQDGAGADEAGQVCEEAQPSQARGGGGPWRAFVHTQCAGVRGTPDLKELSRIYKQLGDDERQRLQQIGVVATDVHRMDPSRPSFGLRPSDFRKELQARGDQALFQQMLAAKSDDEQHRRMADGVLQQGTPMGLQEALSTSKRQMRMLASYKKQLAKTRTSLLVEYAASGHRVMADRIYELAGPSPVWPLHLSAIADQRLPIFELRGSAIQHAQVFTTWSLHRGDGHSPDVAATARRLMEASWTAQHDVLAHSSAPPLPKLAKARGSPCWDAGFCICDGDGRLVHLCRSKFLKHLAGSFRQGTADRDALKGRNVFIKLMVVPTDVIDKAAEEGLAHHACTCLWWHVSAMYLSPFRPTVQRMIALDCDEGEDFRDMQCTGLWQELWLALAELPMSHCLACEFWALQQRPRPIVDFNPSMVRARRMAPPLGTAMVFWDPRRAPRRRAYRSAPPLAIADVDSQGGEEPVDDMGMCDSEDEVADGEDAGAEPTSEEEDALDTALEGHDAFLIHGGLDLDENAVDEGHLANEEEPATNPEQRPLGDSQQGGAAAGAEAEGPHQAPSRPSRPAGGFSGPLAGFHMLEEHGGRIHYFDYGTRKFFEARCGNPEHGSGCIKTRTCIKRGRRCSGRPLGYLSAWLMAAHSSTTKKDHSDFQPAFAQRAVARQMLRAGHATFGVLEQYECQERADGETSEPEESG